MRYAPRHRLNLTLESIAITDIIMNLFIFFFVTFSLLYIPKIQKTQPAVTVDLPRAGQGAAATPALLVISLQLDKPESVFIGDRALPLASLTQEIRSLPPENRARGAVLRCDRQIPIERALRTMDALRQAGINEVSVATQPEGK